MNLKAHSIPFVFAVAFCVSLSFQTTSMTVAQDENEKTKPSTTKVQKADSPEELRILTYNIHAGKGLDGKLDLERIANVIKGTRPHLVALQEVDFKTKRSGKVDQAQTLARLCKMKSVFGKAIPYQGGGYGNAVLASQKIIANNTIEVSNAGSERRVAVGAAIQFSKEEVVTLISTHFDHKSPSARKMAAEKLAGIVRQSKGVVLIAGDLNCEAGAKELNALEQVVRFPEKPAFGFPAASPNKQIDFVLIDSKSKWKHHSTEVIDDGGASDHRPLLVVFKPS